MPTRTFRNPADRTSLALGLVLSLLAALALAPPAAGFVTILSGDEGAIEGVIQREYEVKKTYIDVYENHSSTPLTYSVTERFEEAEYTRESFTISNTPNVFSIETETIRDLSDRFRYLPTGRQWAYVPSLEEIGAASADAFERTLSDGTVLSIPTDIEIRSGDPATRTNPVFRFEVAEPVRYEFSSAGGLGEEGAFVRATLSRLSSDSDERTPVASSVQSWGPADQYFASSVTLGDVTLNQRTDTHDPAFESLLIDALADSEFIDAYQNGTFGRPHASDFGTEFSGAAFTGQLSPGVYELSLQSSWGWDIDSYATNATMMFTATPIPEPTGSLASVLAFAGLLMHRKH